MRISKIMKPLCFLILLILANMTMSFCFEWANGASSTMLDQYYAQEEVDMVFVGASVCSASFDPVIFDDKLGVKSINMGTPAQGIEQSIRALEVAIKEHDINTVIYGMGFFALQQPTADNAEMTFVKALARKQGGMKGLMTSIEYLSSPKVRDKEKSIQYFFPWVFNGVDFSVEAVVNNVKLKLNKTTEEFDPDSTEAKNWRLEKGFRPFTGVVDYETAWNNNSYLNYYQYFDHEAVHYFKKLMKLCVENEIDLIVINSPHPAYDVVTCYETYEMNHEQVKALCAEYNVDYYDFSLVKEELFESQKDYFYDFEHLNYKGAHAFGEAVCELIQKRKNGEKLEEYFYTFKDYMEKHRDLVEEWIYKEQ